MRRVRGTLILRASVFALATSLLGGAIADQAAAAASRAHPRRHLRRPAQVTLAPGPSGAGVPVTMPPVGLSLEYPTMAQDLGTGACPPPALVAQLQALGAPPLELAGDSQDLTAPSGALAGAPGSWETATLYMLPASFWSRLRCLLSAAGDPLTVGLNAKTGQPSWAAQMAAGARSAATNGLAFSLGNEPDLYDLPNYASLSRPLPGEEAAAASAYLQVAGPLRQLLAGAPVIGPELARPAHWRGQLPRVIAGLQPQTVGVHMYPLSACATPRAVTVRGLLSARAAEKPRSLAWVVADARRAHVPAIISEANSASCGGVSGVSDSPAAAVWAVRFVLAALKTGFGEVRFHFSNAPYDPFVVHGERVLARPLDSALTALDRWLPVGARLRTIAAVRGLLASGVSEQPAGPDGREAGRMVILDNEHARAQHLVLHGARSVRVEALTAARAGPRIARLSQHHGRIELRVAANSVLAVQPSS